MSQAKALTTSEFEELKNTTGIYLIDFWASWCGPCKIMEPVIDQLATEEELQQITFLKCNVDEEINLAAFFDVTSIPTFYLIRTTGDRKFNFETHVVKKFVGTQTAFDFKMNLQKAISNQTA